MAKQAETADKPKNDYIAIASETIMGDLREFILDRLRHDHSAIPWHMRPENEQRELVHQTESAVRRAVGKACELIAGGGHPSARGSIAKMQCKNGLQLQVDVAASDPLRHSLMDHVGGRVLLVLADPDEHMGERAPAKIKPDQGSILDAAE
jgi:hypothetical protein